MGYHASIKLRLNEQDLAAIERVLSQHPYDSLKHKPDHQALHTILSTMVNLAHTNLDHRGIEVPCEDPKG
jgi:hypothetical protein